MPKWTHLKEYFLWVKNLDGYHEKWTQTTEQIVLSHVVKRWLWLNLVLSNADDHVTTSPHYHIPLPLLQTHHAVTLNAQSKPNLQTHKSLVMSVV